MVLVVALLAPAILAGGLMAGELGGYREGAASEAVPSGGDGLAFEPVLVPAPVHADLWYEGAVPAPERSREAVAAVAAPVTSSPPVVVRSTPRPEVTHSSCPGEWEDTWLWELCREHERRPA